MSNYNFSQTEMFEYCLAHLCKKRYFYSQGLRLCEHCEYEKQMASTARAKNPPKLDRRFTKR